MRPYFSACVSRSFFWQIEHLVQLTHPIQLEMVYWTIVQRSHGVYDILQHGTSRDGQVYHLSVTHVCDPLARDIAEQAVHVLQTGRRLPLRQRVEEAARSIESRYELWRHARSYGRQT